MNNERIRVRFAPSPTGYLHIGNVRTALFNWLFARHNKGKFILRIEDTDLARSSRESEEKILDDLKWLGLDWDEGPDIGGECQFYRQSERFEIYNRYVKKLLEEDKAYHCYCTSEELEQSRQECLKRGEMPKYDGRCRNLTEAQRQAFEDDGRKPSIRFKVKDQTIAFHDLVRGDVSFDSRVIGDFIIIRSDGNPTYNYVVVIDDALMKITHIIRGDDHLSNTPRQILLYEALGFNIPQFAHISMILGPDRSRLSKRHGATSVEQYHQKGYLPEALVNFLALLGWSPKGEQEIIPLTGMIEQFSLEAVAKSAAIFNTEKLNWMNGNYIRASDINRIVELTIPFLQGAGYLSGKIDDQKLAWITEVIDLIRGNLEYLSQSPDFMDMFLNDEFVYLDEAKDILKEKETIEVLSEFKEEIDRIDKITSDNYKQIMKQIKEKTGVGGKKLFMPVRVALTGTTKGPELDKLLPLLGKERCLRRLGRSLEEVRGKEAEK